MRLVGAVAATALALGVMAGCSSGETPGPPTGAATGSSTSGSVAAGAIDGAGRTIPAGFEQVTVRITAADGTVAELCLLLARSDAQRMRGLMEVTDPGLGGHAGMLFTFEGDTRGGFWMRNTRLPLSIAYLRADGTTVSTADMAPCPDSAPTCPTYDPAGPYRYAIEVPQGRLGQLGISADSRVEVLDDGCPIDPA